MPDVTDPVPPSIKPPATVTQAAAESEALIANAMERSHFTGRLGRQELLRHWDALPRHKRYLLLSLARAMTGSGRGS